MTVRIFIVSLLAGFLQFGALLADELDDRFHNPDEDNEDSRINIEDIGRIIIGYRHHAYDDVADELFDRVSTHNVAIPLEDYTNFVAQFRRKVYDNRDGTYSVLDLFGVKGIVSTGDAMEIAGVPVYAAVGAEHGYDFVNIRQFDDTQNIGYEPSVHLPDDPWYTKMWNRMTERWFGIRYFYDFANASWNFFARMFRSPSHEFQPRYEDALNVVRTPFRLPLDAEGFNAMAPSEIMSYTILGGIFTSVGSSIHQVPWRASLNLSFYVRGAYRITMFRERNGNFAKIKVTRMKGYGRTFSGRIKGDFDIIEGALFGSDISASIVPVRFAATEATTKMFDELYRYDMRTPEGVAAYEKAVYGNFILSNQEAESGDFVQKLYDKDTDRDTDAFELNFNVLLWRTRTSYQLNDSMITITDKDGITHIFKSVSASDVRSGNIFRRNQERLQYFVESTVELEDTDPDPGEGKDPVIFISLFISDRDSFGSELRKYFRMIEKIIRDPHYFNEGNYRSDVDYGRSSMTLHFKFSSNAIDHILAAPEAKVWSSLARAFGIKVSDWNTQNKRDDWISWSTRFMAFFRDTRSLRRIRIYKDAERIAQYFRDVRDEGNPKERVQKIAAFHREVPFKFEVLTVMLELSEFEDLYGQLFVRGDKIENRLETWGEQIQEDRPNLYEQEEREMGGQPPYPRTLIKQVGLSHPEGDDHIRLSFNTTVDPSIIDGFYIRVTPIRAWWFRRQSSFQTPSQGPLYNHFEWDQESRVSLFLERLIPRGFLKVGERYEISFAFKQRDGYWSIQPVLIFKYERADKMYIQWMHPNLEE